MSLFEHIYRHAFERLQALLIPEADRDALELAMLTVQAKPIRDDTTLLPVCFLTGQSQPLLNPLGTGDMAGACGHMFMRSMINYEVLPLIEFIPADGLSDEEAIDLIRTPPDNQGGGGGGRNSTMGKRGGGSWHDDGDGNDSIDLFHRAINTALSLEEGHDGSESKGGGNSNDHVRDARRYIPIICDADCLLSLKRTDVFCIGARLDYALSSDSESQSTGGGGEKGSSSNQEASTVASMLRSQKLNQDKLSTQTNAALGRGVRHARFFKNMLGQGDAPIACSQSAGGFFMEEDLELALLKDGACPVSRVGSRDMKDYGPL